jgi:hypothetical protein
LALKSRQKVFFDVSLFSETGNLLAESEASSFEMGLLNENDWKPAEWVNAEEEKECILMFSMSHTNTV